jgi:hypothetical protein
MSEQKDSKALPHKGPDKVRVVEVPLWQSTLDEAQAAAPDSLKPAFVNKIAPERSGFLEKYTEPEKSVKTNQGEISAPRTDYHTTNPWYFIVALAFKTPWAAERRTGPFMRALTITTPSADAPNGSVVLTKFAEDDSPGEVFRPGDEDFGKEKSTFLFDVASAAREVRS